MQSLKIRWVDVQRGRAPLIVEPAAQTRRTRLRAHLLGQIDDAYRYYVKIAQFSVVRHADGTTAVFVRTVDEAGTQSIIPGSFQIANVGRAHHDFLRL